MGFDLGVLTVEAEDKNLDVPADEFFRDRHEIGVAGFLRALTYSQVLDGYAAARSGAPK